MRRVNDKYDLEPSIAHRYNASVVEKYVKQKVKILDVGCWTGQLYSALVNTQYNYTGIDISGEAIFVARERFKNANWKVSDATKLPFIKSSFDAVLMFEVLEHLGDREQLCINELGRVLKNGGILILSTPAYNLMSILSDPAYFLQNHKHYKELELRKFLKNDFAIQKVWLKGNVIYVSMYLMQMFFKHVFKAVIHGYLRKIWEKVANEEFKTKGGFLGYYLIARKK